MSNEHSAPAGYRVVPVEPTLDMLVAPLIGGGFESRLDLRPYIYQAMIAAAPKAELATLKEIPEQAEIAGYKASVGSLMSAESGALFAATYMGKYEPLITLAHHNAIVSSLKAKASVPDRMTIPKPLWKDARHQLGDPLNAADIRGAEMFNLAIDEVLRLNSPAAPATEQGG